MEQIKLKSVGEIGALDRVGGCPLSRASVLSHHRAYRSVHGGFLVLRNISALTMLFSVVQSPISAPQYSSCSALSLLRQPPSDGVLCFPMLGSRQHSLTFVS